MLLNQNTFHMGVAHRDRNAGDRAVVVTTFASRPRISDGTPRGARRGPLFPASGRGQSGAVTGTTGPRRGAWASACPRLWSPLRRYGLLKPTDANWG